MTITVHRLKVACEELRDELTEMNVGGGKPALIYPMALDVIATSPWLLTKLANKLSEQP